MVGKKIVVYPNIVVNKYKCFVVVRSGYTLIKNVRKTATVLVGNR